MLLVRKYKERTIIDLAAASGSSDSFMAVVAAVSSQIGDGKVSTNA